MAKLICTGITSLDGYHSDEDGKFDWSMPDEEVHRFVNDQERPIGTYLLGRRMYEVMTYWENFEAEPDVPPYILDYADIWRAAEKVVYSTTLAAPSSARTRIERTFDADAIRALKDASDTDISIGGPTLAAKAFQANLVDELVLYVSPVVIGGGAPFLPERFRANLELLDQRRFDNGVVYLQYRVSS